MEYVRRSAGIISYRKRKNIEFLLLKHSRGSYWGHPKGIIENGEIILNAAKREFVEETGIGIDSIKLNKSEIFEDIYDIPGGKKIVYYFLAEVYQEKPVLSYEHTDFQWANYGNAIELVQFSNAKLLLEKVMNFISSFV